VIVGNQDGSREAAVDGETGYVIDPFDLARHAECVRALATRPELRASMGERARARVVSEFSFTGFADHHRELMARLATCRMSA
jgi:glycosyltransferase involved in cell wall biosynthesis